MNKFIKIVNPTYFEFIQFILTHFFIWCVLHFNILWWNIIMDEWNFNEKSFNKQQYLHTHTQHSTTDELCS